MQCNAADMMHRRCMALPPPCACASMHVGKVIFGSIATVCIEYIPGCKMFDVAPCSLTLPTNTRRHPVCHANCERCILSTIGVTANVIQCVLTPVSLIARWMLFEIRSIRTAIELQYLSCLHCPLYRKFINISMARAVQSIATWHGYSPWET